MQVLSFVLMITDLPPELIIWIGRLSHTKDAVALGLTCRSLFEILLRDTYSRRRVYHGECPFDLIKNGVWDMFAEYRDPNGNTLGDHEFLKSSRNLYTPEWNVLVDRLCESFNTNQNARIVLSSEFLYQVANADETWLHEVFPRNEYTFFRERWLWKPCATHALFAGNPEAYIHFRWYYGSQFMVQECMILVRDGHDAPLSALCLLMQDDFTRKIIMDDMDRFDLTTEQSERIYNQLPRKTWFELQMRRSPWFLFALTIVPVIISWGFLWYFDPDALFVWMFWIIAASYLVATYQRLNSV